MQTIEIQSGETIKLSVKISSDANVGSNVSLNDTVVKKSITNDFNVELGNIDDINGNVLSTVSNFFVQGGNLDAIMNVTSVECTVRTETLTESIIADNVKINPMLFMAYIVVQLVKI